jgi:hypothetical protein
MEVLRDFCTQETFLRSVPDPNAPQYNAFQWMQNEDIVTNDPNTLMIAYETHDRVSET